MSSELAPSGRQVVLVRDDHCAVIVEVGGGLRSYSVGGQAVLDGYGPDEMCAGGRGQPLMPWPNRLDGGHYRFGGQEYQVPLTEVDKGNAIHGLVRFANWTVAEATTDRVIMSYRLHPQPGYPWVLDLAIDYRLTGDGLEVRTTAVNRAATPCPFGVGFHPYLWAGTGGVDSLVVTAPASTRYLGDNRGLPAGTEPVDGSPYDFRRPRLIGPARLDTAYGDLGREPGGRAVVDVTNPGDGRRIRLWLDGGYTHLMLFTGDSLGDPARRRQGLAVEPMTCPPNALATGDGLRVLAAGERFETSWGIEVHPVPAG